MCGIAGLWELQGANADVLRATAERMATTIDHRGPDDRGVWLDGPAGLALAATRLAIVDLSAAGHQPMESRSGRFALSYNGEVYNSAELRAELRQSGRQFRGTSDTEVIVEACDAWGVQPAVERFIGMFACALWDRQDRSLSLVRDRVGIKPLYVARTGKAVVFGSELKVLRAYPGFPAELDLQALADYLRLSYVPAPATIYAAARKLLPGHILQIDSSGVETERSYWDAREVAQRGSAEPLDLTVSEATAQLDALLRDAVQRRMVADVPLGAFLSGGIDSSTVAALMQAQSARPVRTFSIGFHEAGYDEAPEARAVARHLGCDHTELYVTAKQALDTIAGLPDVYDEPFADSSQIPTLLLSRLTRQHVTVSLSGDGGDELFGGYTRYQWASRLGRASRVPDPLRRAAAGGLRRLSPARWDGLGAKVPGLPAHPGDKLHKLASVLDQPSVEAIYARLVSHWTAAEAVVVGALPAPDRPWQTLGVNGAIPSMQLMDVLTYLPDDILAKVDRASMAASLEVRVPLLDHRVVEFAWQLPLGLKMRAGQGKWILRQVLSRYVPPRLVERPKMGFGVPLASWLRGPLREWAEDLLDEGRLRRDGYLHPGPIRLKWLEHQAGRRDWHYPLWDVLMFQAWLARWR